MARILLIDDDEDLVLCLKADLEQAGHRVECLNGARSALEVLARGDFELLLLDNQMPGLTGIEFLCQLRDRSLSVPVILMTGLDTPDTHIQARMLGARAYFVKPVDQLFERLEPLIGEMLRASRLMKGRVHLPSADDAPPPAAATALLGNSLAMKQVYERLAKVARSNENVLILGETGTGKEMIVRAIYQYSDRRDKPFIAVNSAALTETLQQSELFGHEKGAFTGAERRHIGKFEQADGGTILLDEIGDMSLATQGMILRVLQEGVVERLGGPVVKVNVRVLACTHRDLKSAIERKEFREDLYYRLNTVEIRLPPLRKRAEDIPLLARHFLAREAWDLGRPELSFHPDALAKLARHTWPGNVRELKSVIKGAVLFCDGDQVLPDDLEIASAAAAEPGEGDDLAGLRAAVRWAWGHRQGKLWPLLSRMLEKELLQFGHAQGQGPSQLVGRLGMARSTLWKRLKELGLNSPAAEESGPAG